MASFSAFDELAAEYDEKFTRGTIGLLMRKAVWSRIDRRFGTGDRVLELNCGTGEDAVHLAKRGVSVLATDASVEMVRVASAKVKRTGVNPMVRVQQLSWAELHTLDEPPFSGLLSNFGGINCVHDIPSMVSALAAHLLPRAAGFICVMGPYSPWEWVWYSLHGRPKKAFRRLHSRGAEWRGITIRYPSIRVLSHALSSAFRIIEVSALGALLPPPFAEGWAQRHPRMLALLNSCERRFETVPPLPWLADHYLMELERR